MEKSIGVEIIIVTESTNGGAEGTRAAETGGGGAG